ncbi:AI-2E family transporter [Arthrobacter sp. TB 23]|uniref:AI-2E family transporter n=1 Tax=Arthrobacter sp. TB 23 TaxID=494419 RepID=UPI000301FABB|nr:AI-2E family transporter [Arthrobacter sp. TB 23]
MGTQDSQRLRRRTSERLPLGGSSTLEAPIRFRAFRAGLLGALGVGVGLVIWGMVSTLSTVLIYVGLALFIVLGMDPLISWLQRIGLPRPAAVAAVFIGAAGSVTGVLYWIIPVLIVDLVGLIRSTPSIINSVRESEWFETVQNLVVDFIDLESLVTVISSFLSDPQNLITVGGGVLDLGAGIAGGITGVIIVLVLSLYFALSLGRVKAGLYQLIPASKRPGFIEVAEDIATSIGRYIFGQFMLSLMNGVLSAIFLSMIGAPSPLLLALIAFVGSAIPMVGTIASSIIITLVCLSASPETALAAGIYYLIYMQVEAYILTPRIMDTMVKIPGSLVVIAVIAGAALGGIIGALVAVPVAASAVIITRQVVVPRQNLR